MDNRIKILIISAAILVIGGIVAGIASNKGPIDGSSQIENGRPKLIVSENRFDLGTVSMADGLARHTIELTNNGDTSLKINSIKTSCMCTEAVLEVDGKKSPKFGMHTSSAFWSESIEPGQVANLEIIFDPNAHGPDATGPITRTVTLLSNNNGKSNSITNITFNGDVIK